MELKNKTIKLSSYLFLIFAAVVVFTISVILSSNLAGASSDASSLNTYNERVQPFYSGAVLFSWDTDEPSTSKVVYGDMQSSDVVSTTNYGYTYSTEEVGILVTKHSMLITGLSQDVPYFFRPVSVKGDGLESIGDEKTIILESPCTYLKNYLKIGEDNDIEEVKKLQIFLRDFEGFSNLAVTGMFDQETFDTVSAFQIKYKEEILAPWGIDVPTGYVYYTTQNKINELYCNEEFPLKQDQLTEISNFHDSIMELPEDDDTLEEIDFGLIGVKDTIPGEVDLVLSEPVHNEDNAMTEEKDEVIEDSNQVVKQGLLASVFSATKNGISTALKAVGNFFRRDNIQQKTLETEEGSEMEDSEEVEDN